jgi:hypothetical protein
MNRLCFTLAAILGTATAAFFFSPEAKTAAPAPVLDIKEANTDLEDQLKYLSDHYGSIADAAFDHYYSQGWYAPCEGYVFGEAWTFPADDNRGFVAYRSAGKDLHRIELPEVEFPELRPILDEMKSTRIQMAAREAAVKGGLPTLAAPEARAMAHCPCEVAQQMTHSCVGCTLTWQPLYTVEGGCYHPQCMIWQFTCGGGLRITNSVDEHQVDHNWILACGQATADQFTCWGKDCTGTYIVNTFCGNCIDQ